jgi:hypothetical protein
MTERGRISGQLPFPHRQRRSGSRATLSGAYAAYATHTAYVG